jgi:hypothetical protein
LSSRRRIFVGLALALLLGVGGIRVFWHWKAPRFVEQRLERITGHRTTVGSVTINHRFELIAYDVRLAGAPPFDGQMLARADRIVVRLRGPAGFWSPAEVVVDGLEVEYLGSNGGDNLHGLFTSAGRGASVRGNGSATAPRPWVRVHGGRLRGSIALAHGPHLALRVPRFDAERAPDGTLAATLGEVVLDAERAVSLRAQALSLKKDLEQLTVASDGDVTIAVAGGGPLFDGLALVASWRSGDVAFALRSADPAQPPAAFSGHWNAQKVELAADSLDFPLRALGVLGSRAGLGLDKARGSLHVFVSLDRPSLRSAFALDVKSDGVDLGHPSVDVAPWREQSGSLVLRGVADLSSGRVDLSGSSLRLLNATFGLDGWVEVAGSPRGSLRLATSRHAPPACGTLFLGQPAPVQQALAGLEVDGKLGISAAVQFDAASWEDLKLDVDVDPICSVRSEPTALAELLPLLRHPSTPVAVPVKLPLGPFHPDFVPLSAMPRHLPGAFLTSEDGKFYRHHGFDLEMIRHALAQNLESRAFRRGASTITQQLAKNLFLNQRRTLARKLEEAVLTWRLQELLGKDRVLELYLNVIELGPGIQGVKQAARAYFGKDVNALSPLESAHLAALTPNPHALARRFRDGEVDEGWQQRLMDLLGMMKRHGRLSAAELAAARASKLVLREPSVH